MNIRVKGLDKKAIYFNFRLDIVIANFNGMDEFVYLTKHMKDTESKPQSTLCKRIKEMTANCSLRLLDINYVTFSKKCV